MMIEISLAIILVLLILLTFLTLKRKRFESKDIEAAVSGTWIKLGLDEKIGAVESHAKDIRDSYKSFEQMLRVPTERSSFGEFSLETMLLDQLPQDMY
ncbi:MAG: hypothetical protein PHI16_01695, partial [Methanocellales archaeon]|nr:hypothetical protein [Methanocellales archaeon]